MKTPPDQILALRLLETRKHGFTFGLFYRRSAKRYLLLFTVIAATLAMSALIEQWVAFWLVLGMFVGCLTRDIGWVISIRRTRPFSDKVTDWDKVQRLAEGKPLYQP